MKYVYKIIPSFPMFEICDEESMDKCIRTVDTHEYLHVYLNTKGYPRVILRKKFGGNGKQYLIHRLVCETYIGPIPEGMEIDHVNRIVSDFRHINLKICSHKENMNNNLTLKQFSEAQKQYYKKHPEKAIEHSKRHKEYFSNPENRKKSSEEHNSQKKWVQQIDKTTGEIIAEYFGIKGAGRKTGINIGNITSCCKGKLKSAGGFVWRYKSK